MTETLIVGVDGSDPSKRAVDFALRYAPALGVSLVVAHVIPWSPYSFSTASENEQRAGKKQEELAAARSQIIDPVVAVAAEAGHEVTPVVRHGDPVDVLVEMVDEFSAAAIVVGRTGDSRVKRALFGSIPGHLVHESPIPVMVVP